MNNIQQLRYAIEVEKTGSISKAAQNLYMGQPQLSKSIRELEDSLGTAVFSRTTKGVVPTEMGKTFLSYAKNILREIEEMEKLCSPATALRQVFRAAVPRASYISAAFAEFVGALDNKREIDISYRETGSVSALNSVADGTDDLAVIRCPLSAEEYFLSFAAERDLRSEEIFEFLPLALMSSEHPLAWHKTISADELDGFTEIVHGDPSVPALPLAQARELARAQEKKSKIAVYERGSQFELLCGVRGSYMWVSPMPQAVLERFSLVQKHCTTPQVPQKDILVMRADYHPSAVDELFLARLRASAESARIRASQIE